MRCSRRPKRARNALYAVLALALVSPAAQAGDVFSDAWQCAAAVYDGAKLTAVTGAKALKFVATKPDCVSRLGTPATAAPMGVVVGLANTGVLPTSQPSCSGKLYGAAAKPVAMALDATLGELGVLPAGAKDQLIEIASGTVSGEALANIPGMDFVTGSLTCGCELVNAGLSTDTIRKVLNTADNIGDKCGGPVWDAAKEVAGEVVDFAGDAVNAGITAVSNLGDDIAGQTKHIPYLEYYDQYWAPEVENYATFEYRRPDSWHGAQKWKELWDPCVSYFDGHTQSEDTAQYTCDNMRSGGPLFPQNYFGHSLFKRVFEFEATDLVNDEREKAYIEFADLKTGDKAPQFMQENPDCFAAASIKLNSALPAMRRSAIDAIFGIPTKERTHNRQVVSSGTPAAKWPSNTLGAVALGYFDEVDAGQFHADAQKAVDMAMADFDVQEKVRAQLAKQIADFYAANRCIKIDTTDRDQLKVDALVQQCPSQACKDKIAADYKQCRSDVDQWHDANIQLISDFDNPAGQRAGNEWTERAAACLTDARRTEKENRYVLNDVGGSGHVFEAKPPSTGRLDSQVPVRIRDTSVRTDEPAPANDESLMAERRRAAAEAARKRRENANSTTVDQSGPVRVAPAVTGNDLPGCEAVRGMMNPRQYVCGTDEAYRNCRVVTQGNNDVRCQLANRR